MTTELGQWQDDNRLAGLRRFAIAITGFNILGHIFLGFEQSWIQPFVSVGAAYAMEILIELLEAWSRGRTPRFLGGGVLKFTDFLLSAHITGLAIAMLLYVNENLWPLALASAIAIGSKAVVRVPAGEGTRHCFNPSNFGITCMLLLFPWICIAQPYMFTENLSGIGDWILPAIILGSGSFLNWRFTHRLPLIAGWVGGFFLQALIRHLVVGAPLVAALNPMMGMAFILFTFYMVTDPATTPSKPIAQFAFGGSVALVYGILMLAHIVFGFFFALTFVCLSRGVIMYVREWIDQRAITTVAEKSPTPARVVVREV